MRRCFAASLRPRPGPMRMASMRRSASASARGAVSVTSSGGAPGGGASANSFTYPAPPCIAAPATSSEAPGISPPTTANRPREYLCASAAGAERCGLRIARAAPSTSSTPIGTNRFAPIVALAGVRKWANFHAPSAMVRSFGGSPSLRGAPLSLSMPLGRSTAIQWRWDRARSRSSRTRSRESGRASPLPNRQSTSTPPRASPALESRSPL